MITNVRTIKRIDYNNHDLRPTYGFMYIQIKSVVDREMFGLNITPSTALPYYRGMGYQM